LAFKWFGNPKPKIHMDKPSRFRYPGKKIMIPFDVEIKIVVSTATRELMVAVPYKNNSSMVTVVCNDDQP